MLRDLSDDEARRALPYKWGQVESDVLPAWVAEMDYAPAPAVAAALGEAVAAGVFGYPDFEPGGPLGHAYAGFAARRFGHLVDPDAIIATVDVTAGVRLALDVLSEPDPVVMTLPGYPPVVSLPEITGRDRWDLIVDPDATHAEFDLDRLDGLLAAGARTVIITQPHNPWGRVFGRDELEGVRDVVTRHGARVIADEIHAPLVLGGAPSPHVPYLSLDGTADHAVSVVSASKAFNTPGLRCAQLVAPDPATRERIRGVPMARNDSWSPLGVEAAIAAYTDGDEWLDALIARLSAQRDLLTALIAEHLPEARMRPLEATYLAWLDLRAYGYDDPAAIAHAHGRVRVAPGHDYQPGLTGHVRLNIATNAARLTEIVRRLAVALTA